jgi:hypothetical protein
MGFISQLFEKTSSSSFSFKWDKTRVKFKPGAWQAIVENKPIDFEEKKRHIEILLLKFPGSPDFFGDRRIYPEKKKKIFFPIKRKLNFYELRDEVNRFAESKEVLDPRTKIRKLMKKHPFNPELRAINGIQVYNDALQSGLDQKKLDVLQDSLIEIGSALHNGCLSIFNISWFIRIYLRYLELLKDRYANEYNAISRDNQKHLRKSVDDLNRAILKLTSMLSIRDKLGGLAMLNAKLKSSVYITSIISNEEIKAAATASLQNDLSRTVSQGKTANYVLLVVLTLALLIARIPSFKFLLADLLKTIPDLTRDLMLQKNMIRTMTSVTDFQLAISSGDAEKSREVADKLFKRCKAVISQHLEYSILTKPHEVDPFLKAAWIAKESSGLVMESEYRLRLEESLKYLQIITGNQGKVKGAFELARQLQNDISFIMAEYGWSAY